MALKSRLDLLATNHSIEAPPRRDARHRARANDTHAPSLPLTKALRARIDGLERKAIEAERAVQDARDEILRLRDTAAAAERDQQELRTARAQLARLRARGFISRILNRS